MASNLPQIPPELVEAGATGHLVVLVGAGASFGSGLPSWKGLLDGLLARARGGEISPAQKQKLEEASVWFEQQGDLLEKASFLRQTMGADWITQAIAATLDSPTARPTLTHQALAGLPGTSFITTNYDGLLEQALATPARRGPLRVLLSDIEGIRDLAPGQVLKLHGDLSAPETLVLAAEDYFRVKHRAATAWKQKLRQFLQKPFQVLLVGYGYGDVDLQEVVDEVRGAYEDKHPGPFWLEENTIKTSTKAAALGLRPVWLASYGQLVPWLEALARAIDERKAQAPAVIRATAYANKVREKFREAQEHAGRLFEAQKFEEALGAFQKLLEEAEDLRRKDPESDELKRLVAVCQLNIGCCLTILRGGHEGRELLRRVAAEERENLPASARAVLASTLAQIGDRDLARTVLPHYEAEPQVKAARQLLDMLDGRTPEGDLGGSLTLGLHRAVMFVEQGRLAEGAREAITLLEGAPEDVQGTLIGLVALERALRKSVWEEPGAHWIPHEDRGAVVQAIETRLDWLAARPLPGRLRLEREHIKLFFLDLTGDERAESVLKDLEREWGEEIHQGVSPEMLAEARANELGKEGKLDEALRMLPPSDHPWEHDFKRADLLTTARRYDQALNEIEELARRWPGRAPIEQLAAILLRHASRSEEALAHARAAFVALPGRGLRVLLATCLLENSCFDEAKRVLEPLSDVATPEILKLRALAAEQLDPGDALILWERYLEGTRDVLARAKTHQRMADLLFGLGRHTEASERAWQAFDEGRDLVELKDLFRCAQFLRLGHGLDEQTRERLQEILKTIEVRFPGDREAEVYRLGLLTALGFPEEAKPVDYQGLVEAGKLQPIALDEFKEHVRQRHTFATSAYAAYMSGQLSFESFCELTGTAAAMWFTRFEDLAQTRIVLCPPIQVGEAETLTHLEGQRILAGEMELLLLHHLGLFEKLRSALGTGGRLLVFGDVWERMLLQAANLEQMAQRVPLERLESLLKQLEHPKVKQEERDPQVDDSAWAKQQNLPLILGECSSDGLARISPRALALWLRDTGCLDRERSERLLQALTPEELPLQSLAVPLPPRLGIAYPPLVAFGDLGALPALLDAIPEKLVIGPKTMELLKARRDDLREGVQAAELALAVQRAVGAGVQAKWIDVRVDRPREIPGLPPLKQPGEASEKLLREPLEKTLSFRQKLLEEPGMLLLAADYLVTASLGASRQAVSALAWPSPDEFSKVAERMRVDPKRVIHLPILVKRLFSETKARGKCERLARLGFVDALRAEDLLDLSRRFSGLDKRVPAQILDRIEWMVRQGHIGAPMAGLRIAEIYAGAIWSAFRHAFRGGPGSPTEPDAKALADTLLLRAEEIDRVVAGDFLQMVLMNVGLQAVESWKESILAEDGHAVYRTGIETAPGRLWAHLNMWVGMRGSRRAACDRALRTTLLAVEKTFKNDRAKWVRSSVLLLSLPGKTTLKHPVLETLGILSANWTERSAASPIEKDLERLTQWIEIPQRVAAIDEEQVAFVSQEGEPLKIKLVAPEAILLRVKSEIFAPLATRLARDQGIHDGRACELLAQLRREPNDQKLRVEYAQMTVVAPWRLVREDPVMLRTWAWRRRYGEYFFPANLQDLCKMLSEPVPLDLGPQALHDLLGARCAGKGIWGNRDDRDLLLRQASEIPGLLPAFTAYGRLEAAAKEHAEEVMEALKCIDQPDDVPAAQLAGDIFFLRLAAARRPYVRLAGGEIDLREELPARFLRILQTMARTAEDDMSAASPQEQGKQNTAAGKIASAPDARSQTSLGMLEAGLLRLCGRVVRDFARSGTVATREWLWLTYRLFQWFWAQLEALAPDGRQAALVALKEVVPPPEPVPEEEDDLLNPFRFAPERFDHRLATVLYAFSAMEEVLRSLPPASEHNLKVVPHSVSSTGIEDLLAEIAARPLSADERRFRGRGEEPSSLDWHGSGAIPDLALEALLELNSEAFLRMPAERRVRWILDLPQGPQDREGVGRKLTLLLVMAVTRHARKLSIEEKVAFEARLRTLEIDGGGIPYRVLGFIALFGAGQRHLEQEAQQLLLENLEHPVAPDAFGDYLIALSFVAPERLAEETERILQALEAAGKDPIPFAPALSRVIIGGEPRSIPAAQALLQKLADRPTLKKNERLRQLLGTLGMR